MDRWIENPAYNNCSGCVKHECISHDCGFCLRSYQYLPSEIPSDLYEAEETEC